MQEWYKQWYGTEVPNWTPSMNWGRGRPHHRWSNHRWSMNRRDDGNDRFDRDSRPQGRKTLLKQEVIESHDLRARLQQVQAPVELAAWLRTGQLADQAHPLSSTTAQNNGQSIAQSTDPLNARN